jgi:hypothetical protein
MDRKHIKRIKMGDFPEGGGYAVTGFSNATGEHLGTRLSFLCPQCLYYSFLPLHSIDSDGAVNASVLCNATRRDGQPCTYHEFVILDDWDPRMSQNAGDEYLTIT